MKIEDIAQLREKDIQYISYYFDVEKGSTVVINNKRYIIKEDMPVFYSPESLHVSIEPAKE